MPFYLKVNTEGMLCFKSILIYNVFRKMDYTVKSHILGHALKPGSINLRTVPQLIGKLFFGMPLKANCRF